MERSLSSIIAADSTNNVVSWDLLPFCNEYSLIMSVSTQKILIMFNNNQVSVAFETIANVNNFAWGRCNHRLAAAT